MATQFFIADTFELHKSEGNIDLINDTIKVALLSDFSPSYSAWQASTTYAEGDIVIPTTRNGRRYRAKNAGDSSGSEPTWPTIDGNEVVDGDITWQEYGGEHCDMEYFSEVSANEVSSGDGYTTGGEEITNKSLANLTTDPAKVKWDGDDVTWTSLTKTIRTGWLYKEGTGGSPADDFVIGHILIDDTPADVTVSGINFAFLFNNAGIYHFTK